MKPGTRVKVVNPLSTFFGHEGFVQRVVPNMAPFEYVVHINSFTTYFYAKELEVVR